MTSGVWALLIALAAALAIGLLWRARQGKVRESEDNVVFPADLRRHLAEQPGEGARVTLLQLSTTFCAPCRHTRILLTAFAEHTVGIRHVEVDLTHHPEWSTPLRVHTTPTTLALDSAGDELFRIQGVPHRDEIATALAPHLP